MERAGGMGVPVEYLKGGRARLECIPSPPVVPAVIVIIIARAVVRTRSNVLEAGAGRDCNAYTIPRAAAISDYL
jgi:hypothetical protein